MMFQQAILVAPGTAWTYGNLGIFYFEKQDYDKAKIYLKKSLELAPDDSKMKEYLEDSEKAGQTVPGQLNKSTGG